VQDGDLDRKNDAPDGAIANSTYLCIVNASGPYNIGTIDDKRTINDIGTIDDMITIDDIRTVNDIGTIDEIRNINHGRTIDHIAMVDDKHWEYRGNADYQ
jgi:hypothetical protein